MASVKMKLEAWEVLLAAAQCGVTRSYRLLRHRHVGHRCTCNTIRLVACLGCRGGCAADAAGAVRGDRGLLLLHGERHEVSTRPAERKLHVSCM